MLQYTLRRLLMAALMALLVSLIVFAIVRIVPGDMVDKILEGETQLPTTVIAAEAEI